MAKKPPKKRKKATKKKKKNGRPLKTAWHKGFIIALEQHGIVAAACRTCEIPRTSAIAHYKRFPKFKAEWDEAIESSTEFLEHEVIRRARSGWDEPVFHNGKKCGVKRRFSDVLLMFELKKRRPEAYRDNYNLDNAPAGPVTIILSNSPRINKSKDDIRTAS